MIFPQPLLIALCLFLPIFFLYKKRDDYLIFWIALTITLDIFNSQVYLNLTAIKLTGLIIFPYVLFNIKDILKTNIGKSISLFYLLMIIMGLVYGQFFPWEDPSGLRTFRDLPQGRSILHLGSQFLELTVALFLGIKLQKSENRETAIKSIFYSTLLVSGSMFIEYLSRRAGTHIEFYHFFTGGVDLHSPGRMRGFCYEPRGAAQACAYGLIFLVSFMKYSPIKKIGLSIPLLFGVFILSFSMTGILTLIAGLGIVLPIKLYFYFKKNGLSSRLKQSVILSIGTFIAIITLFYFLTPNNVKEDWKENFKHRSFIFNSKSLAGRLEVFDSASLNFLMHNPKHFAFGVGPGLVALPATNYIMEKDKEAWPTHFNALPHMGLILMISNIGLIGFIAWIGILFFGLKNLYKLLKKDPLQENSLICFTLLMGLYLLQIRYFYILGLGIGVGGALTYYKLSLRAQEC